MQQVDSVAVLTRGCKQRAKYYSHTSSQLTCREITDFFRGGAPKSKLIDPHAARLVPE